MPFEQRTLDFLYHNRANNSKEWYASHKEDFKRYVYAPLEELIIKLTPTMLEIDPQIITVPRTDVTISRIYRDCRFSSDKSLYRDCMWIIFVRDKKLNYCLPGYYFEISPYRFNYGCGFFQANGETMRGFRKLITDNSPLFEKAFDCYKAQDIFRIDGESFKRAQYPDYPDDIREWLNRKDLFFSASCTDIDLLFSKDLPQVIAERFLNIKPLYDMMLAAGSQAL